MALNTKQDALSLVILLVKIQKIESQRIMKTFKSISIIVSIFLQILYIDKPQTGWRDSYVFSTAAYQGNIPEEDIPWPCHDRCCCATRAIEFNAQTDAFLTGCLHGYIYQRSNARKPKPCYKFEARVFPELLFEYLSLQG